MKKIVLHTGSKGHQMFDEALMKELKDWTVESIDDKPINLPEKYQFKGHTIYRYECIEHYLYTVDVKYDYPSFQKTLLIKKSVNPKEQATTLTEYLKEFDDVITDVGIRVQLDKSNIKAYQTLYNVTHAQLQEYLADYLKDLK